jgi:uncharacterized protein YndB with AHSA1/START domain
VTVTTTEAIRKEIYVEAAPETAFRVFTEQIADWWPLGKYGLFHEDAESVTFQEHDVWQLVERAKDGRESVWGEVLEYEFASKLRMTWHPGNDAASMPTEVEVTFAANGDGTTVVLEHSGWEKAGDEIRAARSGYDGGWIEVLEHYRRASS